MIGWIGFWMFLGVYFGAAICECVLALLWLLAMIYRFWQKGRHIAHLVTEKKHKRRVESLAKMIELERAIPPVASGQ